MDEAAYLRAILDAPDDDLPRLGYADWLDQNGHRERAEFIRIQIELARSPSHPEHAALRKREAELLAAYARSWVPVNALALFFEWRRGFVAVLNPCARGVFGGEDSLKILAEFPLAEELDLEFCMTDAEFCHMPDLPNLVSFGIGGNARVTDDSIRRIGLWKSLRKLKLNGRNVTDASLSHLEPLKDLTELDVSYSGITDTGLSHFAAPSTLQSLDLSNTEITSAGLAVLLPRIPKLRKLNLFDTRASEQNFEVLVGCTKLEELHLGSYRWERAIADADVIVLHELPALRVLDLAGWCDISQTFVNSMRQHVPLQELWINGNRQV